MTRRMGNGFAVSVIVLALGSQSVVHVQQPTRGAGASRLVPTDIRGRITSAFLPPALDPDALVTVVATLAGDPVALAQETASRRLSRAEKDRIKNERRSEQAVVQPSIEALGADVLGAYQSALNGIKVRIPRRQLVALQQVPGVVAVRQVPVYYPANVVGVPRIQAPVAWDVPSGVRGEGIKIAVVDSGIDYTHANFGGPGTAGAYATAFAASALPADPSLFGPAGPKVKGGYDLVGDDYDPDSVDPAYGPRPDPNPLDCAADGVGHGTIVASSAVGFGVTESGQTYTGPYDATTHTRSFLIGPGVAPKADLYAVRVYGCDGASKGTYMVAEAIDWAVDNDMDVINMSLGARFSASLANDLVMEAADNATRAGIVVVAVAGNEGDVPYIARSPGSSTRSISVAASFAPATHPAATVVVGATSRLLQNSNSAPFSGATYDIYVLKNATGGVSLGCKPNTGSPDDWALPVNAANVPGKLVILQRGGTCTRVAKAIYGQQHGAAAVLMINTDEALPPHEGPITQNLDDGTDFTVTIPFFGARASDGPALRSLDGHAATFTPATIPTGLHPFTSSGPRNGDGLLKPDITAPGVNIVSALVGSGTGTYSASGTSLATPMVAGTAALVLQAHPGWKPWQVKAAIINSGRPSELANYRARSGGSGLVSTAAATLASAIAFADRQTTTLNFGVQEFSADFHGSAPIFVQNAGTQDIVFNVSVDNPAGSPHTLSLSQSQVHVPAGGEAKVTARLVIPAATAGDASAFRDVAGLVAFTPTSPSMNGGYPLRVPYYVVPRVSSDVTAAFELPQIAPGESASVLLENRSSTVAGTADLFAWGLESKKAAKIGGHIDLRAGGVQSLANGEIVVFALTTNKSWSSPSPQQFNVVVDTNFDGETDFHVFAFDFGWIVNGLFDGRIGTFVVDFATGAMSVYFLAYAPTDGSSILMPVPAAAIGVTPSNPRFAYTAGAVDVFTGDFDGFESWAFFNPFSNAISTGAFEVVNPGDRIDVPFRVSATEWAATPALGLMVVTQDNRNGTAEANLVRVKVR
jgi:minor extracellular serine protease Vpr